MATKIDYSFAIGKHFAQNKATDYNEYLLVAEDIHEYLENYKIETEDGVIWVEDSGIIDPSKKILDLSQYAGSSGPLFYYTSLYETTGKTLYKDLVLKGADYLDKHWEDQIAVAKSSLELEGIEYSIYLGIASIGTALAKIYEIFGREKDLAAIKAITERIIAGAKKTDKGYEWSYDKSPLLGGGTVLYLYKIYEYLKEEAVLEAANRGADAILAEAIEDERGGYAWRSYAHPNQTRVPNFECGTAGVGYILGVAYEISKDEKYLEGAKKAAEHIKAIAIKKGDGFLVPWHDNPEEEVIFYVSTCHGPAGTSRLFYQLFKTTGDKSFLADIESLYLGLRYIGVPEKQSVGYWNNIGICCGTSGIVQFLINLSIVSGTDVADLSDTLDTAGSILLGQKEKQESGRGTAFPIAFERVKPQNISRSISYAGGAAGVGAALLQLYLWKDGRYSWHRLFDDPYPVKG